MVVFVLRAGYNWTLLELKSSYVELKNLDKLVIIEPYWNWNGANLTTRQGQHNRYNWTLLELKCSRNYCKNAQSVL